MVNTHPQTRLGPGESAASKTATKGTAYGGSEVGSLLGGAVGPPIIGRNIFIFLHKLEKRTALCSCGT